MFLFVICLQPRYTYHNTFVVFSDFYLDFKSNVAVGFLANGELSANESKAIKDKLHETAKLLGPIENEFNPSVPEKRCSTTWKNLGDTPTTPVSPPVVSNPSPSSPSNDDGDDYYFDDYYFDDDYY